MSEEEKDYSKENKKRMLVALAILLGAHIDNKVEQYKDIPEQVRKQAEDIYEQKGMARDVEQAARMPEREV